MTVQLSERVKRIKPSPTLAVSAGAKALKAEGQDIIDLSVGEPDFDTPESIKQAAVDAIHQGMTKYTAVDGLVSLKQAVVDKFTRENYLNYGLDQILVSCGAKHILFNLMQALLNEGDEVIIPAPYWVSYPDMALLAGAKPVTVLAEKSQNFKITAKQLSEAIKSKTRMFILNSPSNPTGVAYGPDELAEIGAVLAKHPEILVVTDDIYEHILWNHGPFKNILQVCPELYNQTIVVNGVSKAYAMTGWRIGYGAGPKAAIAAMKKIQSQSTSNPTSVAQIAAQAALNGSQDEVKRMVTTFKERHDYMYNILQTISGIDVLPADGTFYIFPHVGEAMSALGIDSDVAFAERLLEDAGVAAVPGSAFGAPNYMRFSFATDMAQLNKALDQLKALLKQ